MFKPDVEDYHIDVIPAKRWFTATVQEIEGLAVARAKTEHSARSAMRSAIKGK